MGKTQLPDGFSQGQKDLTRCDVVSRVALVQVEFALIKLERIDAAWIDNLDRERLCRIQGPCDVIADVFGISFSLDGAQQEIVVAEQGIGAFVDHRRVGHFKVRLF